MAHCAHGAGELENGADEGGGRAVRLKSGKGGRGEGGEVDDPKQRSWPTTRARGGRCEVELRARSRHSDIRSGTWECPLRVICSLQRALVG